MVGKEENEPLKAHGAQDLRKRRAISSLMPASLRP
jgi:hypothetical protein